MDSIVDLTGDDEISVSNTGVSYESNMNKRRSTEDTRLSTIQQSFLPNSSDVFINNMLKIENILARASESRNAPIFHNQFASNPQYPINYVNSNNSAYSGNMIVPQAPIVPILNNQHNIHEFNQKHTSPFLAKMINKDGNRNFQREPAIISFSLLNMREFVVRADSGFLSREILRTIIKFPVKLDENKKRLVFPLADHDRLHVALVNQGVKIEPLPRHTIATATVTNQREETQSHLLSTSLLERLPQDIIDNLAPFQRQGVEFAIKNNGRVLIADEMGLGKTRTAISVAASYREDWPVLIVCPSSARYHWQNETSTMISSVMMDPKDIIVIESASQASDLMQIHFDNANSFKNHMIPQRSFVIVSYGLIDKIIEFLEKVHFNIIIADESHYLKNSRAKRTKRLLPLLKQSHRAILLSGTPALSRPIELFTQLHALDPKTWDNEKKYGKRYCRMKRLQGQKSIGFGQDFKGASNTRELHVILSNSLMIRRLKKDILNEIPEKKRKIIKVQIQDEEKRMNLRSLLDEIEARQTQLIRRKKERKRKVHKLSSENLNEADYIDDPSSSENEVKLKEEKKVLLMQLFNMSGEAKLASIFTHIGKFLDDPLSGKVLIFGHHRPVLDKIQEFIVSRKVDYIRIDGRTNSKERQLKAQHFQTSIHCRVGILSITAAGIAITLTAAATVYFTELFWTPGSLIQAEDRAHRIGQINQVSVTYFLADHTIDEILWPLIRKKIKTLGEIVEGQDDIDIEIHDGKPPKKLRSSMKSNRKNRSSEKLDDVINNDEIVDVNNKYSNEDNDIDAEANEGVDNIDDLEDVAKEFAKSCSEDGNVNNTTDRTNDDENDKDDDDDDEDNTVDMNQSSDYLDKLIQDEDEDVDQLASFYKAYIDLKNDPVKLASIIEAKRASSGFVPPIYNRTANYPNFGIYESSTTSDRLEESIARRQSSFQQLTNILQARQKSRQNISNQTIMNPTVGRQELSAGSQYSSSSKKEVIELLDDDNNYNQICTEPYPSTVNPNIFEIDDENQLNSDYLNDENSVEGRQSFIDLNDEYEQSQVKDLNQCDDNNELFESISPQLEDNRHSNYDGTKGLNIVKSNVDVVRIAQDPSSIFQSAEEDLYFP